MVCIKGRLEQNFRKASKGTARFHAVGKADLSVIFPNWLVLLFTLLVERLPSSLRSGFAVVLYRETSAFSFQLPPTVFAVL